MANIKITNFLGVAPKISPELLPNTAGQVAVNCKLYSGDLIPYPQPKVVGNTGRTGAIKTLLALRDPDTGDKKWLSWTTDVDIVVASKTDSAEQRFYYSGDGKPKVSNYKLATAGPAPYPVASYDLGLEPPDDALKLSVSATPFTEKRIGNYSRDAANIVTVSTIDPHGLRTGNLVSVSGFTYLDGSYTQAGTSRIGSYNQEYATVAMTITINDHKLQTGMVVDLQFSDHSGMNGAYSVSVIDANRFAITAPDADSRSGTVTWTNSGTSAINVVIYNHGLTNGAQVTLDFTSGTAVDGTYTITNVTQNSFTVITTVPNTTSGGVRLDLRSFNATNVECTVINDTTFTYFSPGPQIATRYSGTAKVNFGGLTQARSYTFTWITPWGEESIAAKPSNNLFIKEGTKVTVSNIPTTKPPGNNFVRGVKLYRTLAAASGTEYYLLQTLWFPNALAAVQRTNNVARVELRYPHNLSVGDRFKISNCYYWAFNITGGVVTDVIDDYTFEYASAGSNYTRRAEPTGKLYYDVSENPPTTSARYWGDGGNYSFLDDFDSRNLFDILTTDNYDPPPENLQGLTAIQNNILCGFVGNTLYFSEPGKPHAWPAEYAVDLEHDIVGIVAMSGSAFVATNAYPYIVSGTDPANGMSVVRVDANYPCLNKNSLVTMSYGVVYSTHDGLAVYSPNSGPTIITKLLYNNDTWQSDIDPRTVVAEYYGDNYFASHSGGAFVFEYDPKIGGYFVNCNYNFTASWYDSANGIVYYVSGANGDIYQWDDISQPPTTQKWKSKVIVTDNMINVGAARVIADWDGVNAITFRLWVDKQLIFTTTVTDSQMFRLPTGYRTDTFEVEVEGRVRVRAIHIAETPFGLKDI